MTATMLTPDRIEFVDRQFALFLENLDPVSGNYARKRLGLKPIGGEPRKKSGPGNDRRRRVAVRDDMLMRLKESRYPEMTASNFARIVAKKIISHKTRFDPNRPAPSDVEPAFLHFVCIHFSGKLSAKSIENILAKKASQSFGAL